MLRTFPLPCHGRVNLVPGERNGNALEQNNEECDEGPDRHNGHRDQQGVTIEFCSVGSDAEQEEADGELDQCCIWEGEYRDEGLKLFLIRTARPDGLGGTNLLCQNNVFYSEIGIVFSYAIVNTSNHKCTYYGKKHLQIGCQRYTPGCHDSGTAYLRARQPSDSHRGRTP